MNFHAGMASMVCQKLSSPSPEIEDNYFYYYYYYINNNNNNNNNNKQKCVGNLYTLVS